MPKICFFPVYIVYQPITFLFSSNVFSNIFFPGFFFNQSSADVSSTYLCYILFLPFYPEVVKLLFLLFECCKADICLDWLRIRSLKNGSDPCKEKKIKKNLMNTINGVRKYLDTFSILISANYSDCAVCYIFLIRIF